MTKNQQEIVSLHVSIINLETLEDRVVESTPPRWRPLARHILFRARLHIYGRLLQAESRHGVYSRGYSSVDELFNEKGETNP